MTLAHIKRKGAEVGLGQTRTHWRKREKFPLDIAGGGCTPTEHLLPPEQKFYLPQKEMKIKHYCKYCLNPLPLEQNPVYAPGLGSDIHLNG